MRKNRIRFNLLSQKDLPSLHQAFKSAFDNYSVNLNTSLDALNFRMKCIGAEMDTTMAAWYNDEVAAFIINAIGNDNGIKTAYNGGTGVIPAYRGNRLSADLYLKGFEYLKQNGVEQCLLEVISNNIPAFKIYQQLGFEVSREFNCYKGGKIKERNGNKDIHFLTVKDRLPDWSLYASWYDFKLCWQNSQKSVIRNYDNQTIIEAIHRTKTVGIVIFESLNGKVAQLAVDPAYRRLKIGTQLLRLVGKLSKAKSMFFLNIDAASEPINKFLVKNGFEVAIKQKEMVRSL